MSECEKVYCEKCGEEMVDLLPNQGMGMTCPKCGWGWATTSFEEYEGDRTDYSIVITQNIANADIIKIVAEYANVNYVQAKKLVEMPEAKIYTGKAVEILNKRGKLSDFNINFKIEPEFPY